MDSENESLPSFHFESTSFFGHSYNDRCGATSKLGARPKTVDLDTSCIAKIASIDLDVTAYTRQRKDADGSINRSRSSSFVSDQSGSVPTLSSLDTVGSTRDSQFSRKSFSQKSSDEFHGKKSSDGFHGKKSSDEFHGKKSSDGFHGKKSKSRESSGYSTIMGSSSLNTKTETLSRKLSSCSLSSCSLSSFSPLDRSMSLCNSFFQPMLDSTHLGKFDLSFKTRDEYLTYSPTVVHLKIPIRSTRRLDRLKIIRSPRETIEVVLKIRAIDPEGTDYVLIDLVRETEIVPASFNGLSNLAIQIVGNSVGSAIIQMVICSKCGKFSFKITIRVEVVDK